MLASQNPKEIVCVSAAQLHGLEQALVDLAKAAVHLQNVIVGIRKSAEMEDEPLPVKVERLAEQKSLVNLEWSGERLLDEVEKGVFPKGHVSEYEARLAVHIGLEERDRVMHEFFALLRTRFGNLNQPGIQTVTGMSLGSIRRWLSHHGIKTRSLTIR